MSTLLRLVSRIACLIVVVSFALFAIDQAGSASAHQQNILNEGAPATAAKSPAPSAPRHQTGGVRQTIDDASSTLTSPFSGATAGWHNQWAIRGLSLLLALLVYGFALGYLARVLRVRV